MGFSDAVPEWRAERDGPVGFGAAVGWPIAVFGFPGVVVVFAAPTITGFGGLIFVGCIALGLVVGVLDYLRMRRVVVELRVENDDAGTTLLLRSRAGRVRRVPLAAVHRVRVTRNTAGEPEVLGIVVRVAGRWYRSGRGPQADALVGVLSASGVRVRTRHKALVED